MAVSQPQAEFTAYQYDRSDSVYRAEVESVGSLIDIATATGWAYHQDNAKSIDDYVVSMIRNRRFTNGYTITSLREAITNPPTRITQAVQKMRDQLEDEIDPPQHRRRRVKRMLDAGDEMDPDEYVRGNADGWSEPRYELQDKHHISIGVNVAVLGHYSPNDVLYRGAAAVALADLLIDRAFSVEITAIATSSSVGSSRGSSYAIRVPVKSAATPLDIGSVAFALSEIAFFRVGIMVARSRLVDGLAHGGDGSTTSIPNKDKQDFDIILDSDILSYRSAVKAVTTHLKEHMPQESLL